MQIADLDLADRSLLVRFGKGRRSRRTILPDGIIAALQAYRRACAPPALLFVAMLVAAAAADLRAAGYPIGPDNDRHITQAARAAAAVCVAWGANAAGLSRPGEVLQMVRDHGVRPQCLAVTRSGYPQHPLMLSSECKLQPFRGA